MFSTGQLPQSRPRRGALLATTLGWLAAGCAGSGTGLDANGEPTGGAGAPPPLTADLASIQQNVFTPICTRCHSGAAAPEGLQLDAAHSAALLIGVPSGEQPALERVKPGDPDQSYLVLKLEGAAGISGAQMPFGGPYLPTATIAVIRQWIAQGAPDPVTGTASAAATGAASALATPPRGREEPRFAVTVTEPEDGADLTQAPHRILIAFNGRVDPTLLQTGAIGLEAIPALPVPVLFGHPLAGGLLPEESVPIPVEIRPAEGHDTTVLVVPRVPLAPGMYRGYVRRAGGIALADVAGRTLAGDTLFTFVVRSRP